LVTFFYPDRIPYEYRLFVYFEVPRLRRAVLADGGKNFVKAPCLKVFGFGFSALKNQPV
jgi:hypothetical protein